MSFSLVLIKVLLIYLLVQAKLHSYKKRSTIREFCRIDSDCDKTGFLDCFCLTPKCHCYLANETTRMAAYFSQVGEPCAGTCTPWAFCDASVGYKCSCPQFDYKRPNDTRRCYPKVAAGFRCDIDEACGTRALCKNGYCRCNPKEQFTEKGWCSLKKALGESCKKNNFCISNVCSDNICVCPYGFEEIYGICTRNLFNTTCQGDNDCLIKMNYTMCNIQKKICSCNLQTYQQNGKCIPKKRIGEPCNENVECTYDYCKDSYCRCRYSYYLFGEECTEGKKPGADCYLDEECQALNNHSSCVNRFCQCSPMFHLEKKRYCVPVVGSIQAVHSKLKLIRPEF